MTLSVVMIVKNEAHRIVRSLESVRWAEEIIVVDSASEDETSRIAGTYTSHVFDHPFQDFSSQKNFAISKASQPWILVLDADEVIPEPLAREIQAVVTSQSPEKVYAIGRINYFFNQPLRFSGSQNDYPLRLFPRGKASFTQPVHEQLLTDLPCEKLIHRMEHHTTQTLQEYQKKMNRYIPLEIQTMTLQNRPRRLSDLILRPIARFLRCYIIDFGFLDSWAGFLFAFLSAYYTFAKYELYRKQNG
ncbi:MAG: glycosyltransferase family 2 protein [Candidatus Omnitrophica bacterium]|nr:glycosyltransferase family 2 protein [Candidatus Omnitrophota bacterium]